MGWGGEGRDEGPGRSRGQSQLAGLVGSLKTVHFILQGQRTSQDFIERTELNSLVTVNTLDNMEDGHERGKCR
jgi:hypothetical protein